MSNRSRSVTAPTNASSRPTGSLLVFAAITLIDGLWLGMQGRPGGYIVLNESSLALTAIGLGLCMVVPFWFRARRAFGRSHRNRWARFSAVLLAALGLPLSSYLGMRAANIHLDNHEPRVYELRDVRAGVKDGHFVLRTSNWPADVFQPDELRLTDAQVISVALAAEKTAILRVRPGALGYAWIQDLTFPPPPKQPGWRD
ncbi:hypothetical protein ACFPN2_20635 [Steroidobacter flavus]|uniref:Uncharacterized protein n=1 Tax=Steroidobacter flavus TaxID=1842136 RepID=A0ABV8SXL6_9GAMM